MTGEALYEQYKDALRRGHVASLRGSLEDALLAYAEAARIAPERATPHASAGTALLRRRRPADALVHYEVALSLEPRDGVSLLGRAQALAELGRRAEAADAFDVLAEVQAAAGRLADAVDAARRGLELAEGRERRRILERLIGQLRASEPDEPARLALERALQALDGPAMPPRAAAPEAGGIANASPAGSGALDEPAAAPSAPPARAIPPDATAAELDARAEAAVDAGVPAPAVDALLDLAALHERDGRIDAALDACYSALTFEPDSVELHLALVGLYRHRGWDGLADEKLDLLEQMARLDGDDEALAGIVGVRAARG